MTPSESAFERKDKKTSLLAKSMLAERKHKVASIMAMLMFIMSAISSAQVMFLDLGIEEEDSSSSTGSSTLELADEHPTFFAGRADSDGDGVDDSLDDCPNGNNGWTSNQATTDHDEDGCEDNSTEDLDDDNDGVADLFPDNCPTGFLSWTSTGANDYDSDGCKDSETEES